jgi:y4mF family transcriptional regulator
MLVRTPADLGLLIRSRRRDLGLDQQTLARQVGVSRLWIIEFERGKPRAEIGLVLRTLLALGLSIDVAPEGGSAERRQPEPDLIDAVVRAARKKK